MKLKNIEINKFKGLGRVQLQECGPLNVLIGKNNSGKSSILHAIDMAGLALSLRGWDMFQPKLEVKDLFSQVGDFSIGLTYEDGSTVELRATPHFGPQFQIGPQDQQRYKSVLILPDTGVGMMQRQHRTPQFVMSQIEGRNYASVNALDMLYAIRFYATRHERGLTPQTYDDLIAEITRYFPDLEAVESDRTEHDLATLTYTEYGRRLDILYSGTGLKHFLDVLLKTTLSGAEVVLLDEPEMGLHPDLQRRFIDYLVRLSEEKGIQFFLATQSQVLLNYADALNFYRVTNKHGEREVTPVPRDAVHTLMGDLGIRPSDVFNQDLCLLVEGASEVVFFEHVVRTLYKAEFEKVAVAVQQYGGGAAEGIVSGAIDVSNLTPAQKYILWTHDRDAKPEEAPSTAATQFRNRLERLGYKCHVWARREIEFYYPEAVHVAAQQGDAVKEAATLAILRGDQGEKYRKAAAAAEVCVPSGVYLRRLLKAHLTDRSQLDEEVRLMIEEGLLPWAQEILGV